METFISINNRIFKTLLDTWELSRSIEPHGSFLGHAVFFQVDDRTLSYQEMGEMTLSEGHVLDDVQKRYIYKLEDDAIAVYFDDGPDKGKLFHRLKFDENGFAEAHHDCPPDTYHTKMQIKSAEEFEIEHVVKGPRKDYKISSHYKKK